MHALGKAKLVSGLATALKRKATLYAEWMEWSHKRFWSAGGAKHLPLLEIRIKNQKFLENLKPAT